MQLSLKKLSKFIFFIVIAYVICISLPASSECENCKMSERGVQLIRVFEGFSPFRYKDSGGLWTIGHGHLIKAGEHFNEPLLGKPAEDLLYADLIPTQKSVNKLCTVPLRQNQFDALGSFTFNVGSGRLASSTLLKKVNAKDDEGAALQFYRWVYVNGEKITGLAFRRKVESNLYLEKE